MKQTDKVDSMANIIKVIIEITQSLRSHPEVKKGPAGRGTLAFFELLRSLGTLNGQHLTKDNIKKAALVTLPHRIALNYHRLKASGFLFQRELPRYRGSYILSRGVTSRSPYGRRFMVADHDTDFFF